MREWKRQRAMQDGAHEMTGWEAQPRYERIVKLGPMRFGLTVPQPDGTIAMHEILGGPRRNGTASRLRDTKGGSAKNFSCAQRTGVCDAGRRGTYLPSAPRHQNRRHRSPARTLSRLPTRCRRTSRTRSRHRSSDQPGTENAQG